MPRARDIMNGGAECIREDQTLAEAAQRMRDLNVGAMPICGQDERLQGILTDRDIVVNCIAGGGDPRTTTAGELAEGTPIWVDADASEDQVIGLLIQHKIRRLPVIDNRRLVGMISEADIATQLPEAQVAQFARSVYGAPANS